MRFPSWEEFEERITEFQKEIEKKVLVFKSNYAILDKAVKVSFYFLPRPLNVIAEDIYNNTVGSQEYRSLEVLKYFNSLKSQGEMHYCKTTLHLENILSQVNDIQAITSEEETLQRVEEILSSSDDDLNQKLEGLNSWITRDTAQHGILSALGTNLRIVDKVYPQIQSLITNNPVDITPRVLSEQQGNVIKVTSDYNPRETTITGDSLNTLSSDSQDLIKAYEKRMENNFNIWVQVYPTKDASPDPISNAKIENELKEIVKEMCSDLNHIMEYLNQIGIDLRSHYKHIIQICGQQSFKKI